MDNLAHTLAALALARTRLGRVSPLAVPALVVAANLPDADAVTLLVSKAVYLEHHRGISHALLGIVAQILLLTPLVWLLERRVAPDRAARGPFARGSPWAAVAAGLASHPLLDFGNVYGVRPWLPFDGSWIAGDLVYIVDPWLWLLFGGMAALAGRSRTGRAALALLVVLPAVVLYGTHREHTPDHVAVIWPIALGLLLVLYAAGLGRNCPRTVLQAGGAALVLYGGLLVGARARALEQAVPVLEAQVAGRALSITPMPETAQPFAWTILGDAGDEILWQEVDARSGLGGLRRQPTLRDDPRVRAAARQVPEWLAFARHPLAEIHADGPIETVVLTDGRYWFSNWCALEVEVVP